MSKISISRFALSNTWIVRGRSSTTSSNDTRTGVLSVDARPPKCPGLGRDRSEMETLAPASIFHWPSSKRYFRFNPSVPPLNVWDPPDSVTAPRPVAPIAEFSVKLNGTPVAGSGAATVPAFMVHVCVPMKVLYRFRCAPSDNTELGVTRQSIFNPKFVRDWLRGPSCNTYCCRYGRSKLAPVPVPPALKSVVERCCSLYLLLCMPVTTTPKFLFTGRV